MFLGCRTQDEILAEANNIIKKKIDSFLSKYLVVFTKTDLDDF